MVFGTPSYERPNLGGLLMIKVRPADKLRGMR